ncbi:phytoene desaturase family protein [Mycetocola manganoxydans]|uniref:phytoene desaturase family protein n=1 Tax=Mycetocola manganoxydans TaxID=699879 RepID=UPI00199D1992|nr:phytoene desaturase family protein [Mycetocola manganoxydans]GHD46544.1 phytoene desaturase [Mycetocola manganoxydans]
MTGSQAPGTAIVIGAGIAGLATAGLLAKEGYSVTVLESRSEVGGRAGSWEKDGFRFDTGPSWYLMPEVFDHFFNLMGSSAAHELTLEKLDPGYRVFFEKHDEPIDIAADRETNLDTFERVQPGGRAALTRYLASARDTYEIALKRFLYSTFQSYRTAITGDVLGRARTLARLLLEPLDTLTSRTFSDPRLRQILGYPAVFLGSSPFVAPSLYHLMSHLDLEDGVYYPQGGFTDIITRIASLATDAGVTVTTDATVTAITTAGGKRARVTGVRYTDADGAGHRLDADVVVSAADLHHTETTLLPRALQSYPESWWEKRVPGPGAVLLMLGVTGELPELAHHSLFFTEDWHDNFDRIFGKETSIPHPASIYVCRPSATDDSVAPEGMENLFVLVPVPSDPGIGGGGEDRTGSPVVEELADEVIAQIAAWANIPDLAERIVVRKTVGPQDFRDDLNSWRGTSLGPAHTLKQSAFFRGKNVSSKVDGLYYAGGTTVPGIGLPMCLISAELVIKRLRGDISTGPLAEPR